MFFIIKSKNPRIDLAIHRAKRQARLALVMYPMGPTELLLDRHLKSAFGISLRESCFKILQNMSFALNMRQEIIAKIPDPELNKIARVISYGNGKLPGSRILRKILEIN